MSNNKLTNPPSRRQQSPATFRHFHTSPTHLGTGRRLAQLVPAPLIFTPVDWTFLTALPAGAEQEQLLADIANYLCNQYLQWHGSLYLPSVTKFLGQLFEVAPELPTRMIDNYAERPDEHQRSFAPLLLIDAYRIEPTAAVHRWQAFLEGPAGEAATEALEVLQYAIDERMLQPGHRRVLEAAARHLQALPV